MSWISVIERLPLSALWVLTYSPKDKKRPIQDNQYLYHDPEHGDSWLVQNGVTHWMPLPKFPEEEK